LEEIMWRIVVAISLAIGLAGAALAHTVFAQNPPMPRSGQSHSHDSMPEHEGMHAEHMRTMHGMATGVPTRPGQDAFGAIAEIVRLLDADPTIDWAKVDIERLRQHLIDMNEVVLKSAVKQSPIPGGLSMDITGTGRTERAIPGDGCSACRRAQRDATVVGNHRSHPGRRATNRRCEAAG
jgi:hypothetical protein